MIKASLTLIVLSLGLAAVHASYDSIDEYPENKRFILFPDGEGKLHLVDLKADEPEPFFDENTQVHFNLLTRKNPDIAHEVKLGDLDSLRTSNYNPAHPTRFYSHGWGNNFQNREIPHAYFQNGDFNVFVIDWSAGSNTVNYPAAKARVQRTGIFVARFIDFLLAATGGSPKTFHLAGHSLGAHVVGVAGRNVKSGKIHTIFGSDPALPLFSITRPHERISEDSAEYVEIIHTNGGRLGFSNPIGHTDFYPNGGRTQPGCGLDLVGECAHNRAYFYLLESITSTRGFWSWNCRSYEELMTGLCAIINSMKPMGSPNGIESNHGSARGIFYLRTNRSSPFAQGPQYQQDAKIVVAK